MIQKPNTMLATKNSGRWMVLSTNVRNEKAKVWNEVPFPELASSSNDSKAMVSRKSPTKSTKDLQRHSDRVVGLGIVTSLSCKCTQACEQFVTVELP